MTDAKLPVDLPDSRDYFHALWGHDPFPYQVMPAECVASEIWPGSLYLPPASGERMARGGAAGVCSMRPKGLQEAVTHVWEARARVQRCQWHKRENVVSYLAKLLQSEWRRKLHRAYGQPSYETREDGAVTASCGC